MSRQIPASSADIFDKTTRQTAAKNQAYLKTCLDNFPAVHVAANLDIFQETGQFLAFNLGIFKEMSSEFVCGSKTGYFCQDVKTISSQTTWYSLGDIWKVSNQVTGNKIGCFWQDNITICNQKAGEMLGQLSADSVAPKPDISDK